MGEEGTLNELRRIDVSMVDSELCLVRAGSGIEIVEPELVEEMGENGFSESSASVLPTS